MERVLIELKKLNIVTQKGQINKQASRMLKKHPDVYNELLNQTRFLGEDTDRVRIFCIMNNITTRPTCKTCGKRMIFNHQKAKFNDYCPNTKGNSCSNKDVLVQEKYKKSLMKKYGVENPSHSKEINKKREHTNQRKYGGNAPMCSRETKEKAIETNLQRYGVPNPKQCEDVKEKSRNTMMEKYGTPTYAQSTLPEEVKRKIIEYSYDKKWLQEQQSTRTVTDIANEIGITKTSLCKRFHNLNIPIITHDTSYSISNNEMEVRSFISSIYTGEIVTNTKTVIPPYELDIYLPEHNLAIEYCGVFWHSEKNGKGKYYHLKKSQMCQEKGIHLVHIWSNEWLYKQAIVKSRIASLLNSNERIYARKCSIQEVSAKEARTFLNDSHIQGFHGASNHIALLYNDEIVAIMSFGKSRFNKEESIELIRYAPKLFTNVIGGAGRLFKYYIKTYSPEKIISYSDKRWNRGKVYESLGFQKIHESAPNYYYFNMNGNPDELHSRIQFQKHKLQKKLEHFDSNFTEWENMQMNDYDRIWDCGNDVFIFTMTQDQTQE